MMTEESVRPGDTLGRYELLSCVGRGGMAAVWAARHRGAHGFSKIVAVKTMLPELSDDPEFQRMFLAEARVAARIHHSNVVETLDLGEEEGLLYLVMEWIDGETLSAIMKTAFLQGGVPLPIALKLIVDACAGAHAAHELRDDENRPMGLVHRDVSPPNVLVSYSGHVKLADFGVAKTIELTTACTQTGQVKGKFRYMAPEQLLAGPIDRRVDIFALGVGLYQLTTGRHPWPGDTAAVTMQRILSENATSPGTFLDGYPPELERIVLRALDRNPAERFQTAADMAVAVEDFARDAGALATTREVGAYVTNLLGAHGTVRRDKLRGATREADSRNLRDTARQLRRIDETWDALPPAQASAEIVPVRASNDIGEILSLRPWSAGDSSTPILAEEASDSGTARNWSDRVTQIFSRPRADLSRRAMLLGAAVIVVTGAYALGGRQSSDGAAAAAARSPEPTTVEIVPQTGSGKGLDSLAAVTPSPVRASATPALHASATPALHAVPTPSVGPSSSFAPARSERARRAPPHKASVPAVEHPTMEDSEPDVGF